MFLLPLLMHFPQPLDSRHVAIVALRIAAVFFDPEPHGGEVARQVGELVPRRAAEKSGVDEGRKLGENLAARAGQMRARAVDLS